MTRPQERVLSAPLGAALWSLAWPIALSSQLTILGLGVLLFWLGRLVGDGLAVESLLRPVTLLLSWFFGSVAMGTSVLVSRSVGAGERRGLAMAASALGLTAAMLVAGLLAGVPLARGVTDLLAGDLPLADDLFAFFLPWLLVVLPGQAVVKVLLDVANATGWTRFGLVRVLLDLAFTAALVPLLVSVAGLGMAGAPLAQGIGGLLLVGVLGVALYRRRVELGLGELPRGAWRPDWAVWREILAIGLPVQATRIAIFAVQIAVVQIVARESAAAAAGYGVAMALLLFAMMMTLALGQAGGVLIGQCIGANLIARAERSVRANLVLGMLVMTLFIAGTAADRPIIALFTDDPAIADATRRALGIMRWGLYGVAIWQILLGAFAALKTTIKASALGIGAELIGLAFVLLWPRGDALTAVSLGFCVASGLRAALLGMLYARRDRPLHRGKA